MECSAVSVTMQIVKVLIFGVATILLVSQTIGVTAADNSLRAEAIQDQIKEIHLQATPIQKPVTPPAPHPTASPTPHPTANPTSRKFESV